MIKCRRRQAKHPQKLKKVVNGRFFVYCWWKRKRLKKNRFHIPARLSSSDKCDVKFVVNIHLRYLSKKGPYFNICSGRFTEESN